MRDLRLYRLRCRSEMISESERKNHLGHITVEAATAATAAAAATATAASTEVGLFSLLGTRDDADDDEIVWRSASSCGFFVTERWVDACVACLTHITHTQRVTLVSACLPDCLSAASFVTRHLRQSCPNRVQTALPPQVANCTQYVWSHLASRRLHLPLVLCHS